MSHGRRPYHSKTVSAPASRGPGFANQAFSRAAGAPLIGGNRIRLLINARENYPAWLEAIRGASAMSASRTTSLTFWR